MAVRRRRAAESRPCASPRSSPPSPPAPRSPPPPPAAQALPAGAVVARRRRRPSCVGGRGAPCATITRGLVNPVTGAFSPDGRSFYVGSLGNGGLSVRPRHPAAAACVPRGRPHASATRSAATAPHPMPEALAITHDDRFVYAGGASPEAGLLAYARDTTTGDKNHAEDEGEQVIADHSTKNDLRIDWPREHRHDEDADQADGRCDAQPAARDLATADEVHRLHDHAPDQQQNYRQDAEKLGGITQRNGTEGTTHVFTLRVEAQQFVARMGHTAPDDKSTQPP